MAIAKHIKPMWIALVLFGGTFALLLAIRLDLFQRSVPSIPSATPITTEKETWMNIFQRDKKIGYSSRRITPLETGYDFSESTNMRINTMGMVQDIHVQINGILNADFSLSSFDFELRSGLFNFKLRGKREGNILSIHTGNERIEIPAEKALFMTSGALDAVFDSDLSPNQTLTFNMFDPATMGERPVRITMVGEEILEVMGQKEKTRKVTIDFMGTTQTAWIGEDGHIIQEDGFMGIRLQRTTKEVALDDHTLFASQDLTEIVSVASNVPIEERNELTRLRLEISGIPDNIFLDGGRQRFKNGILTIVKEQLSDSSDTVTNNNKSHLGSSVFIQTNHPKIRDQVSNIVASTDTSLIKAQKLVSWIHKNIEKRPVLSIPNALETLEKRKGDCNEHAVLMAAMARAAGIPAQIEAGLVYLGGRFYYHAWNVIYIGKWITVDTLMGQIPADVTHLRMVRGEPEHQIDLMGVIGNINLSILEQSK